MIMKQASEPILSDLKMNHVRISNGISLPETMPITCANYTNP